MSSKRKLSDVDSEIESSNKSTKKPPKKAKTAAKKPTKKAKKEVTVSKKPTKVAKKGVTATKKPTKKANKEVTAPIPAIVPKEDKVKVQIKLWTNDEDDEDEEKGDFIDSDDFEKAEGLAFESLGGEADNSFCVRKGFARVLLDGENVGRINFTLIQRDRLGGNYTFLRVCDSDSSELEDIATKYFNDDGSLNKALKKQISLEVNRASYATSMYINSIELKEPYDRTADDDNVYVGATALANLVNSWALATQRTTFVMYIADGIESKRGFSTEMQDMDARQFTEAGFQTLEDGYMCYEVW